jgi:mannose-6-phosphate isomerase-like protein (cupin superfamily)
VTIRAHAGQIVIVPAGAAHRFENVGDERLDRVSIHPVTEMATKWLS